MTTELESIRSRQFPAPEMVITLPSRLDAHAVPGLEQLVGSAVDTAKRISLDGSAIEHIDKAGLDSLRSLRFRIEAAGGAVELIDMSLALRIGIELSRYVDLPADRSADLATAA